MTSDPMELEDEVQAAAQRLTQDFLCHVIQEQEGWGKKAEDGEHKEDLLKETVDSVRQGPPLGIILGNLSSAASLDLQQDLEESAAELEGETRTNHVKDQT